MFSHTDRHSLFCTIYYNVFCYQIFHLERQDGCGRSYENVIQTFVRTTAICVLPVILCSAMSYFMVRVRFPSLIRQIVVSSKLFDFNHHFVPTIDHFHKWRPIRSSFDNIKISLTNLILKSVIQKNFYTETRLVRLILMHTKEF